MLALSSGVFSEDEWAFDLLYCVAFLVMDKQWLEKNASYMEFNVRNCSPRQKPLDTNVHWLLHMYAYMHAYVRVFVDVFC